MCLFRRKNKESNLIKDKELIDNAINLCDICIHLASSFVGYEEKAKKIKDRIKYMPLSRNSDAQTQDKKIINKLDDLRNLLSSNKNEEKINNLIEEIETLIIYREGIK